MNVRVARMSLGWSFERFAKESGVAVASVYLLERMGTAGPEDDAKMWDALNKHLLERSRSVATEVSEQMEKNSLASVSLP